MSAVEADEDVGLALVGATAVTAAGNDLLTTAAALRAGVAAFAEHPYYDVLSEVPGWQDDQELIAALVPSIDPRLGGVDRLLALALPVMRQLVRDMQLKRAELERTALLLALPQEDPVIASWQLSQQFGNQLLRHAGWGKLGAVCIDQSGHTGALRLLATADGLLRGRAVPNAAELPAGASPTIERCLLVAVDSYHDERRLAWLDEHYRLHSDRGSDGFFPGEAAVALLIEPANGPRDALLHLGAPAFGSEARPYGCDYSSSGQGLQQAIEGVLGVGADARHAPWVLCDLNGESYRAQEWGTVATRLAESFADPLELQHPADCIGDLGAASGALLIAYAQQAFARGYAPAPDALVWTAADAGLRAAIRLHLSG